MRMNTTDVLTFIKEISIGLQGLTGELRRYAKLEQTGPEQTATLRKSLSRVGQKLERLSGTSELVGRIRKWLDEQTQILEQSAGKQRMEFGRQLESELGQLGLKLTKSGTDLKAGIFVFETSFDAGQCTIWLGPQQEKLAEVPLDAAKIVKEVARIRTDLELKLKPKEFLKVLKDSVAQVSQQHGGKDAPILEVLGTVSFAMQPARFRVDPRKENFQEFGRAHFSCALFQLRESDFGADFLSSLSLVTAPRDKTRSRKDFVWVLEKDNGEGSAYCAFTLKH